MSLNRSEIIVLLEGEHLIVDAGCDLLDSNDQFVEDISANLVPEASTVEFDHESVVRTTAKLGFNRAFDWPRIRLRPWITVANAPPTNRDVLTLDGETIWDETYESITHGPDIPRPGYLTQRWDLGVFLAETPQRPLGQEPVHYDVDCYDKLVLLDTPVGRTVHLTKGEPLLDFASALIRPDLFSAIQSLSTDLDTNNVADGWVLSSTGAPTGTSSTLQLAAGRYFQRITATTATTAVRHFSTATASWPVAASTPYVLRLQTKGTRTASSRARATIEFFDATPTLISSTSVDLPIDADWVPTDLPFTAPATTATIEFSIDILSSDGTSATTTLDVWRPSIVRTDQDSKIFRDSIAAMRVAHKEYTWPVSDGTHAIEIINKVLEQAGCRSLYCDRFGNYRMDRLPNESTDAPAWAFDWDSTTSVVGLERTETVDLWDVPNEWVFIRTVDPAEDQAPAPDTGYLTVTNQSDGPASIDARAGRVVRSVHSLDSSDQISFEEAAAAIVRDEGSPVHTVEAVTSPVPEIWDRQVVTYSDSSIEGAMELTSPIRMTTDHWTLPLDGTDQSFTFSVVSASILETPEPAVITGGDEEYDYNGYHYCVFTTAGTATLTVTVPGSAQSLVIGGGAGGGGSAGSSGARAGGGGGGEIKISTVDLTTNETVTVGAAGTAGTSGGTRGGNGGTSSLGALATAAGGGGGGAGAFGLTSGVNGASGGGGGSTGASAGLGADGTAGGDGGDGFNGTDDAGGGGGGAGTDGESGAEGQGGAGGNGVRLSFMPDDLAYAAGGGGGGDADDTGGEGGSDGAGGRGDDNNHTVGAGTTPGSGGGGGKGAAGVGGAGFKGLVAVRTALQ